MLKNMLSAQHRDRFYALCQRCLRPDSQADQRLLANAYGNLDSFYNGSNRDYHNWKHIYDCLAELDGTPASLMENPDAVAMAIWFHDAIFSPGATNNEQLSADYFSEVGAMAFTSTFVTKVSDLILITRHQQPPQTKDEFVMVDIDLSGFGKQWPDFMADSANVRKEHVDKEDSEYYRMHKRFILSLLSRPQFYYTTHFSCLYEETARCNIQKLLVTDNYANA